VCSALSISELTFKQNSKKIVAFSCCQDHLLCGTCCQKIESCPICKQNFKSSSPKRNYLAERMIAQMRDQKKKKAKTNDDSQHQGYFWLYLVHLILSLLTISTNSILFDKVAR
jgi:hypothetical protein